MKHFVGIDLGTTNSAICSYDGTSTRIWKSPEQNDVTPSAIYIDKRGNKHYGIRAYNQAPYNPDSCATLFKRVMGTSTPIKIKDHDLVKTPEECSAEILKVLFGYLSEEIRNDTDTGTVITVPAAFNQMQKEATKQAAEMAGIQNVALMQEPVAAVMSVLNARNSDGTFLIYDLGGGTLDIAIAETISSRVNLLAHGGIAMCGGRDFDRALRDNVIKPWLYDYKFPDNMMSDDKYKMLIRLGEWASERAKIELSANEESIVSLSETETRTVDLDGNEVYLDVPLDRNMLDELIKARILESVQSARDTIEKAGLTSNDIERIVFIGGPTNYKPLRDLVSYELGIPANTDVNPMTAVAEGASLFAESIDWSTSNRSRKTNRGQISSSKDLNLTFNYISRTPDSKAKVAVQIDGKVLEGTEFQIDCLDTAWTSGKLPLIHGSTMTLPLAKPGANTFKIFVFDPSGGPLTLVEDRILITRTAATVDAIPASHSVGIETLEKLGGRSTLAYLVKSGDPLPKKGKLQFKAAESLKAGSPNSLNFKVFEGEIEDPVEDNRPIGVMKVLGTDLEKGVIPAGALLECEYEVQDSGNIRLEVAIPSIGGVFHSDRNFYSRQEGQVDFTVAAKFVEDEGSHTLERVDEISQTVSDPKLDQARSKLESAMELDPENSEAESAQEAMEQVYEARRLLAKVRKEHLKEIRQIELEHTVTFFDEYVRQYAKPTEETAFDKLTQTAQSSIDRNSNDFENLVSELRGKNWDILWRQDWFVVERFKWYANTPHMFMDKVKHAELSRVGFEYLKSDDIDSLRRVVVELGMISIDTTPDSGMMDIVNIVMG